MLGTHLIRAAKSVIENEQYNLFFFFRTTIDEGTASPITGSHYRPSVQMISKPAGLPRVSLFRLLNFQGVLPQRSVKELLEEAKPLKCTSMTTLGSIGITKKSSHKI